MLCHGTGAIHPDFMNLLMDRRRDVFAIRRWGALPAVVADLPILLAIGLTHMMGVTGNGVTDPGYEPNLFFANHSLLEA